MSNRSLVIVGYLILLASTQHAHAESQPLPFFRENCVKCHNADKHKGDIRLDQLSETLTAENVEIWEEVVHNLQRGDMPPEDQKQPSAESRSTFAKRTMASLEKFTADNEGPQDPLLRLSNHQIAHSVQDLLGVDMDITGFLIQDPVDKHGYSMQSELDISGSYLELYFDALRKAVYKSVPDLGEEEEPYRVIKNDWEQLNYLTKWESRKGGNRKLYRGDDKKWLGGNFKLPLPPQHEHKMFLEDNRPEASFRIRLFVRNEPPTGGGQCEPQTVSVFLDNGFKMQYAPIDSVIVPAKEGLQEISFFGNLENFSGVASGAPDPEEKNQQAYSSWYRILSIQNNNPLTGNYKPLHHSTPERHAPFYPIRGDDLWKEKFGEDYCRKNGIPGNFGGVASANGKHNQAKPIYPEVIKKQGHLILERVEFETPYHESWPPPVFQRFLTADGRPHKKFTERIFEFASLAWHQPLSAEDKESLIKISRDEIDAKVSGPEMLRNLLVIILSDPKFLYLNREPDIVKKNFLVARHQRVTRLAYFLWNGLPDTRLIDLANAKPDAPLGDAELLAQVDRLLADPKAERFIEDFAGQWIGFETFEQVAVNPNFYKAWRPALKADMRGEAVAFFSTILKEDLSCLNLLDSDFITVNEPLAKHYGLTEPVAGLLFQKVKAPADRGGVLSMGVVLQGYSNGEDAHAVNRGVWVRGRLLGNPPSDPPPDTGTLADAPEEDQITMSVKQVLEKHRTSASCYDCHKDIDPWGIAMEGFDAVGLARTKIIRRGKGARPLPVVKKTEIGGTQLNGLTDLKKHLLEKRTKEFSHGFAGHLYSHALGRKLDYRDEEAIRKLQSSFAKNDHRLRDLIKAIVTTPKFLGN
jgi:hypothetical protein